MAMKAAAASTMFAASGNDVGGRADVIHAIVVAPMTRMRIGEMMRSIASCARHRHAASPGKRRSGRAANVVRLVFFRTDVLTVDSSYRRLCGACKPPPSVVKYPWYEPRGVGFSPLLC